MRARCSRVEQLADDGEGQRQHPARPQPLHGAEEDQLLHAARLGAQHRADQEQHHRDDVNQLAPVQVGELAVDRDGGGRGLSM